MITTNDKQRHVFDIAHMQFRDYIKKSELNRIKKGNIILYFLTGGGGVDKLHRIKAIHISLTYVQKGKSRKNPRILLIASTGAANININGATVHTGLSINVGGKMYPLNDGQQTTLRNRLSEQGILIKDQITMVSNALFYQVHQSLNEMFQCDSDIPFSGLAILICGDLYQLPPVRRLQIYASTSSMKGHLSLKLRKTLERGNLQKL